MTNCFIDSGGQTSRRGHVSNHRVVGAVVAVVFAAAAAAATCLKKYYSNTVATHARSDVTRT